MGLIKQTRFSGLVVSLQANYLEVEVDSSWIELLIEEFGPLRCKQPLRLLCTRRSRLDYHGTFVNVGDRVWLESIDWERSRAVISEVEVRKSWLSRPAVANVTQIIVVFAYSQPSFDLDQASRFLITAEQSNLDIKIVLTKRDLVSLDLMDNQLARFKEWGYKAIAVSIHSGQGIQNLKEIFQESSLSVLCGPSGVGKTSLLNYLLPKASLRVGSLSERLGRGRHTTRHVELFSLNDGSRIADTPGFNRPELIVDPKNLQFCFPELRSQLTNYPCKFRDCLHVNESGCAINRSWERYPLYKKCIEEMINSYR